MNQANYNNLTYSFKTASHELGVFCVVENKTHELDCRTCFHKIDCIDIEFIIATILVAISIFPNIQNFIEFVETALKSEKYYPKFANNSQSKYAYFLSLTKSNENCIRNAYEAFMLMLSFPKMKLYFDTEPKRRFLVHLTMHHASVIEKNASQDSLDDES